MNNIVLAGFVVAGLVIAGYVLRADFAKYSIFTVGVFKRVRRKPAKATGHECSELYCDASVEGGEKRIRYKEIVVAGCPVVRYGGGALYACEEHVSFEFEQGEVSETTTERVAQSVAAAIVEFGKWQTIPNTEREETSPFDNAVSTTSTAMDIVPAAFLIITIAIMVGVVRKLQGR